jgi:hypothetical protein
MAFLPAASAGAAILVVALQNTPVIAANAGFCSFSWGACSARYEKHSAGVHVTPVGFFSARTNQTENYQASCFDGCPCDDGHCAESCCSKR